MLLLAVETAQLLICLVSEGQNSSIVSKNCLFVTHHVEVVSSSVEFAASV